MFNRCTKPPAKHIFEHNTLVFWALPTSKILYFNPSDLSSEPILPPCHYYIWLDALECKWDINSLHYIYTLQKNASLQLYQKAISRVVLLETFVHKRVNLVFSVQKKRASCVLGQGSYSLFEGHFITTMFMVMYKFLLVSSINIVQCFNFSSLEGHVFYWPNITAEVLQVLLSTQTCQLSVT